MHILIIIGAAVVWLLAVCLIGSTYDSFKDS